jgi:hypothetical protein
MQGKRLADEDEEEEDDGLENEDTAYSRKMRSKGGRAQRGKRLSFDEENEDEESSALDFDSIQQKKSRSLKRIGTSSPFTNKDGSIDRRRVNSRNRRNRGEEEESGGEQEKTGRRRMMQQETNLDYESLGREFRNKDGSIDRRRVNPRNRRHGRQDEEEEETGF